MNKPLDKCFNITYGQELLKIPVLLDREIVGHIQNHGSGYYYKPRSQIGRTGETFITISAVKRSIEGV